MSFNLEKIFLPFPQLDEQLFDAVSEPSQQVDYADFLHNLVIGVEEEESGHSGDSQEIAREKRDSIRYKNEAVKKERGRGRPASKKSVMEKRKEATVREKKRMKNLVRLTFLQLVCLEVFKFLSKRRIEKY